MKRNRGALLLVLLALFSIGIGLARGEADTVWLKSARICLECIGIG